MGVSNDAMNRLGNAIGTGAAVELQTILNGTPNGSLSLGANNITLGAGNITLTSGALTVSAGALTASGNLVHTVTSSCGARPKVGTSAGWVVGAANNVGSLATMAASQTGGTLVVYLPAIPVGATITGFSISASINSAGATVTLDANLRSYTPAAAATATDASIGSITQISKTAAAAITASNLGSKTGLSTVTVSGTQYYLLVTGTTGASTTIELNSAEVTYTTI